MLGPISYEAHVDVMFVTPAASFFPENLKYLVSLRSPAALCRARKKGCSRSALSPAWKMQTRSQTPSRWEDPQQGLASVHTQTCLPHPAPTSNVHIHKVESLLPLDSPDLKGFVQTPSFQAQRPHFVQVGSLETPDARSPAETRACSRGPMQISVRSGIVENVMPLLKNRLRSI